jgi:hypothetical protein
MTIFYEKKNSCLIRPRLKFVKQLYYLLKNAKHLNLRTRTTVNGIHEMKVEKLTKETKFYLSRNKMKHFDIFGVSQNKQNFAKQLFCLVLFHVSRNKKGCEMENPSPETIFP